MFWQQFSGTNSIGVYMFLFLLDISWINVRHIRGRFLKHPFATFESRADFYQIGYYAPQIFQTVGVSKTNSSLFATGVYGTVKVITTAIFLLIGIDKLGRRKSLLFGAAWMSIMMFIIVCSRPPKIYKLMLILLGSGVEHSPTYQRQRCLASVYRYGLHDLSLCHWLFGIVGAYPLGIPF
jgi:MFS family permease